MHRARLPHTRHSTHMTDGPRHAAKQMALRRRRMAWAEDWGKGLDLGSKELVSLPSSRSLTRQTAQRQRVVAEPARPARRAPGSATRARPPGAGGAAPATSLYAGPEGPLLLTAPFRLYDTVRGDSPSYRTAQFPTTSSLSNVT